MRLIPITKPFNKGVYWINPERVQVVKETNIGHENRGVIGTVVFVEGMNPIETEEKIGSVLQRIQGAAPDLLTALEDLVDAAEREGLGENLLGPAEHAAREAISKAKDGGAIWEERHERWKNKSEGGDQ